MSITSLRPELSDRCWPSRRTAGSVGGVVGGISTSPLPTFKDLLPLGASSVLAERPSLIARSGTQPDLWRYRPDGTTKIGYPSTEGCIGPPPRIRQRYPANKILLRLGYSGHRFAVGSFDLGYTRDMSSTTSLPSREVTMPLQEKEIHALIAAGESETLELKTSVPNPDTIASHVAAFANSGGGILLMGVKEPNTIVGVSSTKAQAAISSALSKVVPSVDAETGFVQIGNANVAYIKVKKAPSLIGSAGGYYTRRGASIRPLTADEIRSSALSHTALEKALSDLSANATRQAETIDKMSEELRKANSIPRKIGLTALGAGIGAIAKHLLDVVA